METPCDCHKVKSKWAYRQHLADAIFVENVARLNLASTESVEGVFEHIAARAWQAAGAMSDRHADSFGVEVMDRVKANHPDGADDHANDGPPVKGFPGER